MNNIKIFTKYLIIGFISGAITFPLVGIAIVYIWVSG